MKSLFISVLLALVASLFGQTSYEQSMDKAMDQWESASTPSEYGSAAKAFTLITKEEPTQWEPRYYAILGNIIHAFYLPEEEAFDLIRKLEVDYQELTKIIDNDETKVLKGMMLTVKVSKDPMTYGQALTPEIMATYHTARKLNPKNPRVLFQIAEYEIAGAPYMGKDPKEYCPLLTSSITLFEQEAQQPVKSFEPRWGIERAQKLYATICSE